MPFLLRQIAQFAMQQAAANPKLRAKVAETARSVVDEAKEIGSAEDRPRAAGQALRRALNKLQGDS